MQDLVELTGIVIKSEPVGDYDKRLVLLTKEKGRITCFVKGARRQGSRFMACSDLFCFGNFRLYQGRTAYNLSEAVISNYFEQMRSDFEATCYGMYFMEIAYYYSRENVDGKDMLKLLYLSLVALLKDNLNNKMIKSVFEIKAVSIEGEYPGLDVINRDGKNYNDSTIYAVNFVVNSIVEKLYTFTVSDEVLKELEEISTKLIYMVTDRKFNSLEMLSMF